MNEVIGRRKNQTILACSSVKTVSPKIVTVYVQSATSINLKSTHQKKKTRRKKESHVDWISCNSCRKWVHPICTGLTKKENIKINKIIKEKKVDYFFKCLKCSISSITSSGSLTEIVQNQLHTKRPTTDINFSRKTTPEKIKIKRDITTQTEIYKERKYTTTPDTLKHNTQIEDRNNTQVKKGNQAESHEEIIRDTKTQPS